MCKWKKTKLYWMDELDKEILGVPTSFDDNFEIHLKRSENIS